MSSKFDSGIVPIHQAWDREPAGVSDWRTMMGGKVGDPAEIDFRDFLAEEHHRLYGRPWCMGAIYYRFLRRHLAPEMRVLDFGCGAGRLGIHLIRHLAAERYIGVDVDYRALRAFADYEIPLHCLEDLRPFLFWDDGSGLDTIDGAFDAILDCWATAHMTPADRLAIYRRFADRLAPGGRVFSPSRPLLEVAELAECGLRLETREHQVHDFLVDRTPKPSHAEVDWHVLVRGIQPAARP